MMHVTKHLGSDVVCVQLTLSAEAVREFFQRWDDLGLTGEYAAHYRYDMVHPVWYATLLSSALAKALSASKSPPAHNRWLLVPFVAGALDVVENLVHQTFLADRANITQGAVLFGNGAAQLKWLLVIAALVAAAVLAVRARKTSQSAA